MTTKGGVHDKVLEVILTGLAEEKGQLPPGMT